MRNWMEARSFTNRTPPRTALLSTATVTPHIGRRPGLSCASCALSQKTALTLSTQFLPRLTLVPGCIEFPRHCDSLYSVCAALRVLPRPKLASGLSTTNGLSRLPDALPLTLAQDLFPPMDHLKLLPCRAAGTTQPLR